MRRRSLSTVGGSDQAFQRSSHFQVGWEEASSMVAEQTRLNSMSPTPGTFFRSKTTPESFVFDCRVSWILVTVKPFVSKSLRMLASTLAMSCLEKLVLQARRAASATPQTKILIGPFTFTRNRIVFSREIVSFRDPYRADDSDFAEP